jgi:hypothetical protein
MNPSGLAQATVHAVIPDVLAENRFKAARRNIERQPCMRPLGPLMWATTETLGMDSRQRWRDMGNGVFWLVGE